jgi:superfamily II DNA or RNA helicase
VPVLPARVVEVEFPDSVKAKGSRYLQEGRVRLVAGSAWRVRAVVAGTATYSIGVGREDDTLRLSCTCPYFESDGPCKHLWATLLLARDRGFLRGDGHPIRDVEWDDFEDGGADDLDGEDDSNLEQAGGNRLLFPGLSPGLKRPVPQKPPEPPAWSRVLASVGGGASPAARPFVWPEGCEILYVIDAAATIEGGALRLEILRRDRAVKGGFCKPKRLSLLKGEIARLPDEADRSLMALLSGPRAAIDFPGAGMWEQREPMRALMALSSSLPAAILPLLCGTDRCFLRVRSWDEELHRLSWDEGPPWELWLESSRNEAGDLVLQGSLKRGEERLALAEPVLLLQGGLVFTKEKAARLDAAETFRWVSALRREGSIRVPAADAARFVESLLAIPHLPRLDLPEQLRFDEVDVAPRPRLRLVSEPASGWQPASLRADLTFDYEGTEVPREAGARRLVQADRRRVIRRDETFEAGAVARLCQLGFQSGRRSREGRPVLSLSPGRLPEAARALLAEGWRVEAEGRAYRQPGASSLSVTTGADWFELHGSVDFGDQSASLPALLSALKRREGFVVLGDGSLGLLPEEWLEKHALLAKFGHAEGDHIRFTRGQAGLLDALLAAEPAASCDALFLQARNALARFEGVHPCDPPSSFQGSLRPYQREGLGWLTFLRDFGFGGCLADDMGLGKTVQVLALLDSRRGMGRGPSLVVVPRSLVFNWKDEAARFTPGLSILDYTGIGRGGSAFGAYDAVVTTYGTLKRDILTLKEVEWDYVILDEAQAAKNAASATAKAVRLLKGKHRLALSGTPIENHLGELFTILDFLNPGFLGTSSVFGGKAARDPDDATRKLLSRALRPFVLRRTKGQVASDLPAKLEQTLLCEMEAPQRKSYVELRDHYRRTLLARVDKVGLAKSRMHVLEALLRLRQAACHPGLLDVARAHESSAKLEALLPQLAELREEGHKALVFSQFTSFLAILRERLSARGVPYEYLDGKTRDRAARVERFQTDPACPLFLISLKAGGLGLNLTAAGYVFLLDPWWNPAVEAQAVDRTHRIGQTRPVFAYRLITKDTIEEKVVELQKSKKRLADSILSGDAGPLSALGREELELLLS